MGWMMRESGGDPPTYGGSETDDKGMKRMERNQDEEDNEARAKNEAKAVTVAKPALDGSYDFDNMKIHQKMGKPPTIPMLSSTSEAFSMETRPPPLPSLEEITKAKADLNALGFTFENILHQIHLMRQRSSLEILSKAGVLEDADKKIAMLTQMAQIQGQIAQLQGPIAQLQKEVESTTVVILGGRSRL